MKKNPVRRGRRGKQVVAVMVMGLAALGVGVRMATGGTAVPPQARQEAGKANTLTQEEIAGGWIMLFDGETAFGWKIEGEGKVEGGALVLGGEKETVATCTTEFGDDVEMRFESRTRTTATAIPLVHLRLGRLLEHESELSRSKGDKWDENTLGIRYDPVKGSWNYKLVSPSGTESFGPTEGAGRRRTILGFKVPAGCKLWVRSVKLQPRGLKAIFNGKDKSGWKEIPGHKSVYSVTKEGYLNVKDGNGQIETEGTWDNFILQLAIISNGDHLNSGVFFRGDPGGFWTGYESQIRNEWLTDVVLKDGTKLSGSYTAKGDEASIRICKVDGEHVAPTNEVKSFAKSDVQEIVHHRDRPVDYGTGGMYFYQPARKVVPNDYEWFTKTIVAHGNHMAVWINGYQTADFTDTRPRGTNARQNQRLEAGTISVQGHDPTTDLSFRNIRIAPLPKPE